MRPLAITFALILTLSACSDDTPTDPAASTATPTSAATAPSMPAAATEFTPSGASTFISHYVNVLDYASKTGDVAELERLSDPDCGGCSDYVELFEDTYESGGYLSGRDWSRGPADLQFDKNPGAESFISTTIQVSSGTNRRRSTDPEKYVPASEDKVTFGLRFEGSWAVTQFGLGELQ